MERICSLAVADFFCRELRKMGVRLRSVIDTIDLTVITASRIRFMPQTDAATQPEEFESKKLENRRWAK